jgi:acetyltransferase-like isoleucine patch superfamily enzyme
MISNPFNPGYYSTDELCQFGFKSIGHNVMVGKNCTIIGLENISIGNNVRIDGSTVLSASNSHITIGNNVHVGGGSFLIGGGGITIHDFCNLSQNVKLYSVNDNYSGETMTNPTVPSQFTQSIKAPIILHKHVIIGSSSIVLPGCTLNEGVAVGALSLVKNDLNEWTMHAGSPCRFIKNRSKSLLNFEKQFLNK